MSNLLIDESPLQVLPSLAVAIGLNEALILQQVHYWLGQKKRSPEQYKGSFKLGEWWIYNSVPQWNKQFPFWGDNTIRRALASLREQGLLVAEQLADDPRDKTLWYRINYAKLEALTVTSHEPRGSSKKKWTGPSTQNGQMGENAQNSKEESRGSSSTQNGQIDLPTTVKSPTHNGQVHITKMGECLTETSSETSAETTTENLPPPQVPPGSSAKEEEDLSSASQVQDKAEIKTETLTDDQQRRVEDMLDKIAKITGTSIDLEKLRPLALECVQREHKDAWLHTLSVMKLKMAETVKPKNPNRFAATVLKNALESPPPKKVAPKPVAATVPSVTAATPPVVVPEPQAPPVDAPAAWAVTKAMHELSKPWFKAKHGRASSQDDWTARAKEIEAARENSTIA